jgi:hypothetical protein
MRSRIWREEKKQGLEIAEGRFRTYGKIRLHDCGGKSEWLLQWLRNNPGVRHFKVLDSREILADEAGGDRMFA